MKKSTTRITQALIGLLLISSTSACSLGQEVGNSTADLSAGINNAVVEIDKWIEKQGFNEQDIPPSEYFDVATPEGVVIYITGTTTGYCVDAVKPGTPGLTYGSNEGNTKFPSTNFACSDGNVSELNNVK